MAKSTPADTAQKLHLAGEIIETIQREGRQIIKVQLKQCTIEIDGGTLRETHLGDSITIDADTIVMTVRPTPQV
jgi:hypothetical protein